MHSSGSTIAVFGGEFVAQLTHFELVFSNDSTPTADIQMLGYGTMQQFGHEMIEYIQILSGGRRYDFSGCYITSHSVEDSSLHDQPILVDMTIEAMNVTTYDNI